MKAPLEIHTIAGPGPIINATLMPPNSTNGINLYEVFVFSNETVAGNCKITYLSSPLTCAIGALEGEQNYTISAFSCITYNETIVRSTETMDSFFLPRKLQSSYSCIQPTRKSFKMVIRIPFYMTQRSIHRKLLNMLRTFAAS